MEGFREHKLPLKTSLDVSQSATKENHAIRIIESIVSTHEYNHQKLHKVWN